MKKKCLKTFIPMMILAWVILVPVNFTGGTLTETEEIMYGGTLTVPVNFTGGTLTETEEIMYGGTLTETEEIMDSRITYSSGVDKLSISNIKPGSKRYFAHIVMAYVFTAWTCYVLYTEYNKIATMRIHFLASQRRCANHFTVLVRNVPPDPDESPSEHVDHFFRVNHPEHYLTNQVVYNANKLAKLVNEKKGLENWLTYYQLKFSKHPDKRPTRKKGFLGLWGKRVDSIEWYTSRISELDQKIALGREKVLSDPKAIMPVAFVSFNSRWGAAVCSQTQQSKNPTIWLTEWAPEPRDIFWDNLSIPFLSLAIRRLVIAVALFFLIFIFMIPIIAVQSLANLGVIEELAPFLQPIMGIKIIKSFIQGFLPGLALKLFLLLVPTTLMIMSKIEGHVALSVLERKAAAKHYYFMLVNVFLGSAIAGTAFEQLNTFLNQSPTEIPKTIGMWIPTKATFFITYIMVDGWAGIAGEIIRLKPLIFYHLKNMFLVKTEKDRDKAMDPGSVGFPESLPRLELYFLLGLVYAVMTPLLLPFIIIFFAFGYLVYRHQVINVYNQEYESAAAFWPHVHVRIIGSLVLSQIVLLGFLSTRQAASFTPILIVLPILTIWFHKYCKRRFQPAFRRYPLKEAMAEDILERVTEPGLNLRKFLKTAYLHPAFKSEEDEENEEGEGTAADLV